MTEKKPGLFKRAFSVLGRIFSTIRNVFSFLIFGFFILAIGGMFGENLQPIPEKGALTLRRKDFLLIKKHIRILLIKFFFKMISKTLKHS